MEALKRESERPTSDLPCEPGTLPMPPSRRAEGRPTLRPQSCRGVRCQGQGSHRE